MSGAAIMRAVWSFLLCFICCVQPVSAQVLSKQSANSASFEFWGSTEFQLAFISKSPSIQPGTLFFPDYLRLYTEQQYAHDLGLQQTLFRLGPVWLLSPGLSLGAHLTSAALPSPAREFQQEVRLELEPIFKGQFQALAWTNRHRLEYRIRSTRQFFRYRVRLALSYPLVDCPWTPFVSNELHFQSDFESGWGLSQNRFLLGLSQSLNHSTQFSLSYQHRWVLQQGQWVPENGLMLSLLYTSRAESLFQLQAD
jgi:hypothetical protein